MASERTPDPPVPGFGPMALVLLLGLGAVLLRVFLPATPEPGDGVFHYLFARYAPEHPRLLLDLWAKPLFTFLGMPFAQLGAWGMALLNALLFALTAWPLMRITVERSPSSSWLVPVLLLPAPMYLQVTVAGMTEVLFGAVAAWTLWLTWKERWRSAALMASLLPFARPEWVGFLPFLVLWFVWCGAWRALPWLAAGTVVMSLLGGFVKHDVFWLLKEHPYQHSVDFYGKGSFWHYVAHARDIAGAPLLVAAAIGSIALALTLRERSDEHRRSIFILSLALAPVLAITFIHSWIWWRGTNGSFGLLRVMATVLPFLVLVAVDGSAPVLRALSPRARSLAVLLLGAFALAEAYHRTDLPVRKTVPELVMDEAAAFLRSDVLTARRLALAQPYLAFALDRDLFDSTRTPTFWRLDHERKDLGLAEGELICWDSRMGPNEGGIQLDQLMGDTGFTVLRGWSRQEPEHFHAGGQPFEVYLFERRPSARWPVPDTLIDLDRSEELPQRLRDALNACPDGRMRCLHGEYPLALDDLVPEDGAVLHELRIAGELVIPDGTTAHLVFTETDAEGVRLRYHQADLGSGPFNTSVRVPRRGDGIVDQLYWWVPGGAVVELKEFTVIVQARP